MKIKLVKENHRPVPTQAKPEESITGTWKYDERSKSMVKVSDRIPRVSFDCTVPKPYLDEHLGHLDYSKGYDHPEWKPMEVTSAKQKKQRMEELGYEEVGGRPAEVLGRKRHIDLAGGPTAGRKDVPNRPTMKKKEHHIPFTDRYPHGDSHGADWLDPKKNPKTAGRIADA